MHILASQDRSIDSSSSPKAGSTSVLSDVYRLQIELAPQAHFDVFLQVIDLLDALLIFSTWWNWLVSDRISNLGDRDMTHACEPSNSFSN
jgi:hypothetical protein